LSFFTTDEHYGADVSQLYNLLTGFSYPGEWNHLAIAPLDLRKKFTTLIRRETENARKGMKGKIMAMMNSLADNEIVKLLYEASQAGVKIQLIVRGICILKPGMKGVSENISVTSIIGEFLQHARIYYFYNGGEEEFFLASADWMRRNLDGRIEILFPVRQKLETDFIKTMFKIQLNDTVNAWTLHPKGNYKRVTGKKDHNCFQEIYKYIKDREKAAESTNAAPIFKPVTSHREK